VSVEAYVIAAVVDEGTPKKAFQAGISAEDFEIHDEEWAWIIRRAESRKPITPRLFKSQFPEFDFILPREKLGDLIEELKQERAYLAISAGVDEILSDLDQENAIEKAMAMREILGDVLKLHAPHSDIHIKGGWETHYERVKQMGILRANGEIPGIPTGLPHLDVHWGGLQPQASILVLGRPGDAKSMLQAKLATEGAWGGYRMGVFSPEMTEHQHYARFHTMLSAKKEVQEALGLKGAFRNRALKDGHGFNMKSYRKFLQWMETELPGEIFLFTQKYRSQKMNVGYIRTRIEDLGLDGVIIDPIYKLKPPRRRGNKWEELQEITDSLVDLAHEFNIPMVMSNQANRALVGKRGDAPDSGSSFGSDAPVQEADTVIGVKHHSEEKLLKLRCTKNRHGEPFSFSCRFLPNIGVMQDVTPIHTDYLNGYDPEKVEELSDVLKIAQEAGELGE
jgi:replicative DNA helicase